MDQDSIFGHHHRAMNRMMNSFFGGTGFGGGFGGNGLMGPQNSSLLPFGGGGFPGLGGMGMGLGGMGMGMSPFGGFPNLGNMMSDPNSHCFSSTSVMSVSSGPDGRPQVYQASSATRQGPGGLKETRKTLTDTRSGTKKMSVGRHLGDRGHVVEREENMNTGQREQSEDFINLAEEEAPVFNQEWRQRAYGGHHHAAGPALTAPGYNPHPAYNHHHRDRGAQLQITPRAHRSRPETEPVSSGVTIEELPPSDEEEEPAPSPAPPTYAATSEHLPIPRPRVSRRKTPSKERAQKAQKVASKRAKKY